MCLCGLSPQVTHNRSLDGVLDQLNSKLLTDAGPLQLIDHDDAGEEDTHTFRALRGGASYLFICLAPGWCLSVLAQTHAHSKGRTAISLTLRACVNLGGYATNCMLTLPIIAPFPWGPIYPHHPTNPSSPCLPAPHLHLTQTLMRSCCPPGVTPLQLLVCPVRRGVSVQVR